MNETYLTLNSLFETLANALGYSYQKGRLSQINTVFRNSGAKYPLCYALEFVGNYPNSTNLGPESLKATTIEVIIIFVAIEVSGSRQQPDTDNDDKTAIKAEQWNNAERFLFNLYEGNLPILQQLSFSDGQVYELDDNQTADGAMDRDWETVGKR